MRNAEYNDPRLVEVYDVEGPWGRDDEYFLALVNETPGARVLDLGCGTGRLAVRLAAAGHFVTGIDPSPASLSAARIKAGAERVTWMLGTASTAPQAAFDVAIMTGHVAQFLLTEDEWADALGAVWRALVPGGRLAFHAYDPAGRIWERWNPTDSRREVVLRRMKAHELRPRRQQAIHLPIDMIVIEADSGETDGHRRGLSISVRGIAQPWG